MPPPKIAAAVTAALLALAIVAPRLPAQLIPEKYHKTIDKGLTWLATQQAADGSWSGNDGQNKISVTALAGTALLLEGSSFQKGKYAKNIRKAVEFVVKHSHKGDEVDGLISDTSELRVLFGHGYAVEFLARMYGDEGNRKRRDELKDVLTRAVKYLIRTQSQEGGWYYVWEKGRNANEGAVTAVQLAALHAARNAGIPVPKEKYKKAQDYFRNTTAPNGAVQYSPTQPGDSAAITAAVLASRIERGVFKDEQVKRWLKYCRQEIPLSLDRQDARRIGYQDFAHYYFARAVFNLDDTGWDRMFGEKAADRLTWSAYRTQVFDGLMKAQHQDGSWASHQGGYGVGPVYTTAVYCTILQLDNDAPPPRR